jgi:hypothetical protein
MPLVVVSESDATSEAAVVSSFVASIDCGLAAESLSFSIVLIAEIGVPRATPAGVVVSVATTSPTLLSLEVGKSDTLMVAATISKLRHCRQPVARMLSLVE